MQPEPTTPEASGGRAWLWLLAGWLVASVRAQPPEIHPNSPAIETRIPRSAPPRPQSVELDRLSPRDLRRLPGIGEARALAIAKTSWERGGIDVDGLDDVPSIGPGTVERIRAWLERSGPRP